MRFVNQSFANDTISLDYNEFIDCHFTSCTLVLHGGQWSLIRAKFAGTMNFSITGAAAAVVDFMKFLRLLSPEMFEGILNSGSKPTLDAARSTLN